MIAVLSPSIEKFRRCGSSGRQERQCSEFNQADVPDSCFSELLWEEQKLMNSEAFRVRSFTNWPSHLSQKPETLAKAGLFYTGQDDNVKCPFCFGVLKKWQPYDNPMDEHRKLFPHCPFVLGHNVGNIPLQRPSRHTRTDATRTVNNSKAVEKVDFTQESVRIKSFQKWPENISQKPEYLAYAGFFHDPTEEKRDRVRCAYCHGKLYNWRDEDDPMLEHARCFPQCPYIKLCMGEQLIDELLCQHNNKERITKTEKSELEGTSEKGDIFTAVIEMGFPAELVTKVMNGGRHCDVSLSELIETLLVVQNETESQSGDDNTGSGNRLPIIIDPPANEKSRYVSCETTSDLSWGVERNNQGSDSSHTSASQNYCAHSLNRRRSFRVKKFVFMPCGHVGYSGYSSVTYENCPECNVTVTGTVNLFEEAVK